MEPKGWPRPVVKKAKVMIGMVVGNGKGGLPGAKEPKNYALVWRLLGLVLLGACGMYICLVGVDRQILTEKSWLYDSRDDSFPTADGGCSGSNSFVENGIKGHFPQPTTYSRGECECTPVHNFVILSMQRSGSGWFETLLNDHPNVSSHGEIFSKKERRDNFTAIRNTLDVIYNLDWNSSASKVGCTNAVGHKWMLNQGVLEYHRDIAAYYEEKDVSIVLLVRRNLLKRLISVLANAHDRHNAPLNGTHKSHVHKEEEADTLAKFKPTVDVENLTGNFKRVQEYTDDALKFFNRTRLILLYYEDLVNEPERIVKIQEFLGVPFLNLSSKQVKIHTKPLQDQIENWDEVATTLKGTEYESFLEDVDYDM